MCLDGLERGLVGSELAADGTGLLGADVKGLVLLALVVLADVAALHSVDCCQDAGNVLANNTDLGKFVGGTSSDLDHAELLKLSLKLGQLLHQLALGLGPKNV